MLYAADFYDLDLLFSYYILLLILFSGIYLPQLFSSFEECYQHSDTLLT